MNIHPQAPTKKSLSDSKRINFAFEKRKLMGQIEAGVADLAAHVAAADPHPLYVLHTEVDDTPVNGALTDPISSNWAYDHLAAADPHPGYLTQAEADALYSVLAHTHSHATLTNLSADDHTQYALLAGRVGGQTLVGDTASAGKLTLKANSSASSGEIWLYSRSDYIIAKLKAGGSEWWGNHNIYQDYLTTNSINFTVWSTSSGGATIRSRCDSASADAVFQSWGSANTWTWGLDDSDSDKFVLSLGTVLGTGNVLTVATNAALAAFSATGLSLTGTITASNFSGSSSGTNTGDQTITLTGDVTGSGTGSFAATIAADAVTYAKMQNVSAQYRVLGRITAAAGDVEELTPANLVTVINQSITLSGSNTGDQTITLTGDVTGSGTGSFAATIANDAVTYAKLQNVSAQYRVLGRITAAAGDAEELTPANLVTVINQAITLSGSNTGDQDLSGYLLKTGGTMTGVLASSLATGPQISLNGATSNWIQWAAVGVAAPTFTTSSAGTKLLLYPAVSASSADYAIGIEGSTLWFGTTVVSSYFKWYGGTTLAATLTGAGALTLVGALAASNFSGTSSGTNTGDQTITLTGDVTGSGTGSFATTLTAASVLAKLLTVDGAGSALDADLLDGQHGSYYQSADNINAGTLALVRGGTGAGTAAGARTNLGLGTTDIVDFSQLKIDSYLLLDMPSNSTERGAWNPIVTAIRGSGVSLYYDEDFRAGVNSVAVYNNGTGGAVTHTRDLHTNFEASVAAPNASGYSIKISYLNPPGGASPGYGGFYQTINSEENHTFVQVFQAKIPSGRSVALAENAVGTNNTSYWLTNTAGTGKWEWYARVVHCGDSGTFSSSGHVYITGGADASFDWYLASCNAYDVTEILPGSMDALANTVGVRNGSGYFFATYFNQSSGNNENPTISQIYVDNGADGYLRKASLAHLKTSLGLTGTNSGDQTITLTGDVTGSGTGSFAATIANDAVTFAKMLNSSAASKLVGRGSASGAGDFEEITLGTNLSMSGTTLNASGGGVSDGDKGDITVTGSGATWTIDNDVVTYAKMQNVSATNRILGRSTAGAGDVEEITVGGDITQSGSTFTVANDAITFAKMQNVSAASKLLGRGSAGGSGDTEEITLGTGLSMSGTTLSATGQILQSKYAEYTAASGALTPTIPVDNTIPQNTEGTEILTQSITPTSASNKIRVRVNFSVLTGSSDTCTLALFRDSGANALSAVALQLFSSASHFIALEFQETAPGTSTYTYKLRIGCTTHAVYVNYAQLGGVNRSTMVIEEVTP